MKRGDLYRVYKGNKDDPKNYRVYLIVSRQILIDSQFPTLICAPVRTKYGGLPTQVEIGVIVDSPFFKFVG
jgi:mRNA interferase MazF